MTSAFARASHRPTLLLGIIKFLHSVQKSLINRIVENYATIGLDLRKGHFRSACFVTLLQVNQQLCTVKCMFSNGLERSDHVNR